MSLKLGSIAPNFTADTTHGMINFYEWTDNCWTILLSHPKDFTEVCTTELIWISQNIEIFQSRNVKVISLSVDKLIQHSNWLDEIKNSYDISISTPLISDKNMRIAKLYNMIHNVNDSTGDSIESTARTIYIISPDKKVCATFTYPVNAGRNFDEVVRLLDSLFVTSSNTSSTPANWTVGDDYITSQNDKEKIITMGTTRASAKKNDGNSVNLHVA